MSTAFIAIHCPYCGETFDTAIDASAGDTQHYVEDCAVCCRPITLLLTVDGDEVSVRALRDDDSG